MTQDVAAARVDLERLAKLADAYEGIDSEAAGWPIVILQGRPVHVENAFLYAANDIRSLLARVAALEEGRALVEQSISLMTDEYDDTAAYLTQAHAFLATDFFADNANKSPGDQSSGNTGQLNDSQKGGGA